MERTKKADPDAILWKKIGGASVHLTIMDRPKIVKPGETFYARVDEIPTAFRDMIVPVDPLGSKVTVKEAVEAVKIEEAEAKSIYNLKHRGGGWWDVVNEDGKRVNESAMKKPEAEELLNSLL